VVIVELMREALPGTQFTFAELMGALQPGVDEPITRQRVYRAVRQANETLLAEESRYAQTIRNVGYKILAAHEHLPAALTKKERATNSIRRGVEILRFVRRDELDDVQRQLHEGELAIMAGLIDAFEHSERRHDEQEAAIAALTQRVDRLESPA
jgi:hypothetical protein